MRLLPRTRSCDLWLDFEVFTFCVVLDEPICMSLFYEPKGEDQFMNDRSRAMSHIRSELICLRDYVLGCVCNSPREIETASKVPFGRKDGRKTKVRPMRDVSHHA